uniref:Uncharacterized protein n=1 Tax=Escherichia phage UFV-AREG1 TaxID=1837867 RepID=A0A173GAL2_9CAUD
MGFPKLEVGDLVLTKLWNDAQSVEICQYRGATGNLMYTIYNPEILLECHLERFIKDTDSMPYSLSSSEFNERLDKITNKLNSVLDKKA